MNDFVQAADFFKTIQPDERVFLLVRHGERNHIMPDDPDFGAHVGLTSRGREQAFNLGKCIPADGGAVFFSSPVGRCMETALNIAKGRVAAGFAGVEPEIQSLQELAEYFVQDFKAYEDTLRAGFYEGICKWLSNELAGSPRQAVEPFCPLARRSEEMRQLMLKLGTARFNIFCSHDAWVVPCLVHFCKQTFSPQCWMNFLTGMAVVQKPSGEERIVAVTGLEDGNLIF